MMSSSSAHVRGSDMDFDNIDPASLNRHALITDMQTSIRRESQTPIRPPGPSPLFDSGSGSLFDNARTVSPAYSRYRERISPTYNANKVEPILNIIDEDRLGAVNRMGFVGSRCQERYTSMSRGTPLSSARSRLSSDMTLPDTPNSVSNVHKRPQDSEVCRLEKSQDLNSFSAVVNGIGLLVIDSERSRHNRPLGAPPRSGLLRVGDINWTSGLPNRNDNFMSEKKKSRIKGMNKFETKNGSPRYMELPAHKRKAMEANRKTIIERNKRLHEYMIQRYHQLEQLYDQSTSGNNGYCTDGDQGMDFDIDVGFEKQGIRQNEVGENNHRNLNNILKTKHIHNNNSIFKNANQPNINEMFDHFGFKINKNNQMFQNSLQNTNIQDCNVPNNKFPTIDAQNCDGRKSYDQNCSKNVDFVKSSEQIASGLNCPNNSPVPMPSLQDVNNSKTKNCAFTKDEVNNKMECFEDMANVKATQKCPRSNKQVEKVVLAPTNIYFTAQESKQPVVGNLLRSNNISTETVTKHRMSSKNATNSKLSVCRVKSETGLCSCREKSRWSRQRVCETCKVELMNHSMCKPVDNNQLMNHSKCKPVDNNQTNTKAIGSKGGNKARVRRIHPSRVRCGPREKVIEWLKDFA